MKTKIGCEDVCFGAKNSGPNPRVFPKNDYYYPLGAQIFDPKHVFTVPTLTVAGCVEERWFGDETAGADQQLADNPRLMAALCESRSRSGHLVSRSKITAAEDGKGGMPGPLGCDGATGAVDGG